MLCALQLEAVSWTHAHVFGSKFRRLIRMELYLHRSATQQAPASRLYWELLYMFREICFYFTQTPADGNLNRMI